MHESNKSSDVWVENFAMLFWTWISKANIVDLKDAFFES